MKVVAQRVSFERPEQQSTVSSVSRLVPVAALYLVTSLCVCQLLSGLGVTSWGVYPSLTECWPWGRPLCQVTRYATWT